MVSGVSGMVMMLRFLVLERFDGESDLALLIDAENLDLDLLVLFQEIMHVADIFIRDLGDVDKADFLSTFFSGSSTKAPKFVMPVTTPSTMLPTSMAKLILPPCGSKCFLKMKQVSCHLLASV